MWEWWLVRAAAYRGLLSAQEWERLATVGRQCHLAPRQRLLWGPAAGVILVSRGVVHLSGETARCRHTHHLHRGDMIGTVQPLSCHLWSAEATTLHLFHHAEWLAALESVPGITQKLLRAMAWNALRAEQQPPSHFSALITAG